MAQNRGKFSIIDSKYKQIYYKKCQNDWTVLWKSGSESQQTFYEKFAQNIGKFCTKNKLEIKAMFP